MILRVAPVTLITPLNVKNVSILHFCISYNVLMNVQITTTVKTIFVNHATAHVIHAQETNQQIVHLVNIKIILFYINKNTPAFNNVL